MASISEPKDKGQDGGGKAIKSKADRFRALASTRTNVILDKLTLLENCANKSSYDYTDDQVETVFHAIRDRVDEIERSFLQGGTSQGGIEL
jgi:hypothetical protein